MGVGGATDLGDACGALGSAVEVRIEDPAITAAAFAEGSVAEDVDAWITSTAWLEVTESRAPDALGEARAIATSPGWRKRWPREARPVWRSSWAPTRRG